MKQKQHGLLKGLNSIINPLINIVDMYLDVEKKHYEEMIDNNETIHHHIYQDLLATSHWIKENHTMKEKK